MSLRVVGNIASDLSLSVLLVDNSNMLAAGGPAAVMMGMGLMCRGPFTEQVTAVSHLMKWCSARVRGIEATCPPLLLKGSSTCLSRCERTRRRPLVKASCVKAAFSVVNSRGRHLRPPQSMIKLLSNNNTFHLYCAFSKCSVTLHKTL